MVRFREALVLDAAYSPLAVVSWRRAVTLALARKARVLELQGTVTGCDWEIAIPSVVVLLRYIRRFIARAATFSRHNVYMRDRFTCQYCEQVFPGARDLTLDHVVPRSRGGSSSWDNVVTSCMPCNARKACHTPREAGMRLMRPPFAPRWLPRVPRRLPGRTPAEWQPYLAWAAPAGAAGGAGTG
jgi:5-methylcytosine-specific restriction endonuclease McrA